MPNSVCQQIRSTLDLDPAANVDKVTDPEQLQQLRNEFVQGMPPLPNLAGKDAQTMRAETLDWRGKAKQHSTEHSFVSKLPTYPAPEWLQTIETQIEAVENSVSRIMAKHL